MMYYTRYLLVMETTLTIRLPAKQREALRRRAAAEKRSESAVVRDLIERELQRGFDFDNVRHLVGRIASPPRHWDKDPWRKHIRQRNWRR
jgi:predicted DNA-binding protein